MRQRDGPGGGWWTKSAKAFRLQGGLTDIEGARRHMRLGVRTLQRHLAVEGVSYRTIVARERCRRALDLLSETRLSITAISRALG